MRHCFLALLLMLGTACAGKSAQENEATATKFGLISSKQEADPEQVEKDSKTRTSVFASFSSGGGVSVGLGFLVGLFDSGETEENPIRYQINLLDGSEITIYHLSRHFEVNDCVVITMHEDMEQNPPSMERSKDGC